MALRHGPACNPVPTTLSCCLEWIRSGIFVLGLQQFGHWRWQLWFQVGTRDFGWTWPWCPRCNDTDQEIHSWLDSVDNDPTPATVQGNYQPKWPPRGMLFQSPLMWHLATEDLEGGHWLRPWCMLWQLVCGEIRYVPPCLEVFPDLCFPNRQIIRVQWSLLLRSVSLIRRRIHLHWWS